MQKHLNLVDLVKSFPTNIYLQNLASIQPRTSPVKVARPLAMLVGRGERRDGPAAAALLGLPQGAPHRRAPRRARRALRQLRPVVKHEPNK